MEGLRRLLKQEKFTGAKSVEIIREQYDRGADPIKGFLDECTESVGGEVTPKKVLFEAFCEYCREHSIPMIYTMKGTFKDRVKKTYIPGITKIDGKAVRVWQGCKLTGYV